MPDESQRGCRTRAKAHESAFMPTLGAEVYTSHVRSRFTRVFKTTQSRREDQAVHVVCKA